MRFIGIDPGVHTGVAVWDASSGKLENLLTMQIHRATRFVEAIFELYPNDTTVVFEDARLRTWFGNSGREKLMGAGSVKRDSLIWEEFCEDLGIPYIKVAPEYNVTKLKAPQFKSITQWPLKTSEHSRDAAMLVIGR